MLVKNRELVERVKDVLCDVCGCSCTPPDGEYAHPEFGTLEADWGYFSKHDGMKFTCHLCEVCFFRVVDHIQGEMSGKVEILNRNP